MHFLPLFLTIAVNGSLNDRPRVGDTIRTSAGSLLVGSLLGEGSYGTVYRSKLNGSEVALKIGKTKSNLKNQIFGNTVPSDYMEISHEIRMMKIMKNQIGFPRVYAQSTRGRYKYYVMELLGKSLNHLRPLGTRPLTLIGIQIIDRLAALHKMGYLMYDIHPGNFVLKDATVYAIDLGMAVPYVIGGVHVPYTWSHIGEGRKNPYWTSRSDGEGHAVSRRDDLERFLYMIVDLLINKLPWKKYSDVSEISVKKWYSDPSDICLGKSKWLIPAFQYVFGLGFDEEPDYEYLRSIFRHRLTQLVA